MSAETLAFADGFDCVFTSRAELKRLLGQHVPLLMFTDSAGLFDTITHHSRTSEGRLMLDIYAARESYRNREMDNIVLIRSQHNVADSMTKLSCNEARINVLRTHRMDHSVVQFVLDPTAPSPRQELTRSFTNNVFLLAFSSDQYMAALFLLFFCSDIRSYQGRDSEIPGFSFYYHLL
jgi:hypothetical protein